MTAYVERFKLVLSNVGGASLFVDGQLPSVVSTIVIEGGIRVQVDRIVPSMRKAYGFVVTPNLIHLPTTAIVDCHGGPSSSRSVSEPTCSSL